MRITVTMAKFRCRPVDMLFTVVCDNFALINLCAQQ